jgi:hypothetical protein
MFGPTTNRPSMKSIFMYILFFTLICVNICVWIDIKICGEKCQPFCKSFVIYRIDIIQEKTLNQFDPDPDPAFSVVQEKNLFEKVFLKKKSKFHFAFFIFLEDFLKNTFFGTTDQNSNIFSVFLEKFPRKN